MNEPTFSIGSLAAIAAWLGLALAAAAPPGNLRQRLLLVAGLIVPMALCLLYAYLLVVHWGSAPGGGFSSLSAVLTLFSAPGKMLGGWMHFLAFDLLVGWWIVDDTLSNGRSRAALFLVLPATFMYGPVGLLLHVIARSALRRAIQMESSEA
jgi:hypothetical protein